METYRTRFLWGQAFARFAIDMNGGAGYTKAMLNGARHSETAGERDHGFARAILQPAYAAGESGVSSKRTAETQGLRD